MNDTSQLNILAELIRIRQLLELQNEYLKESVQYLKYLDEKKKYDW